MNTNYWWNIPYLIIMGAIILFVAIYGWYLAFKKEKVIGPSGKYDDLKMRDYVRNFPPVNESTK